MYEKSLLPKNFTNGYTLYCDKNFTKFNFANHARYPPESSVWMDKINTIPTLPLKRPPVLIATINPD